MKKEQQGTKFKNKGYNVPIPQKLIDATVSEIFADSKYYIGLMSIFYEWAHDVLSIDPLAFELTPDQFEDDFQEAFEKLVLAWNNGKIIENTPLQLFCYLRTIFRRIVIDRSKKRGKFNTCSIDADIKHSASDEYDRENEPLSLCMLIEKLIKMHATLSKAETEFWEVYKYYPDKNEKAKVMKILDISSNNYNTTKHRLMNKIVSLKLENIIYK